MAKRIKNNKDGIVYSTNPEFGNSFFDGLQLNSEAPDSNIDFTIPIRIWLEKKQRGGRPTSIVRGMQDIDASTLNDYTKKLKSKCGVGGSMKNGIIIIQGDNREKIKTWLTSQGYKNVKLAGS